MNAPDGAKKPQDHKPSAAQQLEDTLSDDELLADLPELKAPGKLRLRQRNVIMALALKLKAFTGDEVDYSAWTVVDLNREIARRNAEYGAAEQIVAASSKKDDLVAALAIDDGGIHLSEDDPRLPALLDILADIDDFAESIATDPAAYVAWAEGKDYEVFTALLSRYASAVGESTASSN